jgi:5-methylcytosine-specific restriction endonuclease McrA
VTSVLNTKVLVLNRSYLPINVTSVRRAVSLLYRDVARAVDAEYRTFEFEDWLGLLAGEDRIGLVSRAIRVPRVILLQGYDRLPQRHVRFSRANVYARDRGQCQYCGRRFARAQLNLDHVVPRSRGGASAWENVVCSCLDCNRRKGSLTPTEAGMRLVRKPYRPQWTPFVAESYRLRRNESWLPFLAGDDRSFAVASAGAGG